MKDEKSAKLPRIPKLEKPGSQEKPAKHEKRANSEEKSTPSKSSKSHEHGSAKKEAQKKTPKRERSKTPSKGEDRKKTPNKSLDESVSELPGTPQVRVLRIVIGAKSSKWLEYVFRIWFCILYGFGVIVSDNDENFFTLLSSALQQLMYLHTKPSYSWFLNGWLVGRLAESWIHGFLGG